jgi:DNA modification methylase
LDYTEMKETIDLPEFSELRYEQKFEFNEAIEEDEPVDIDGVPIVVKPGDVFQLGNHTLYCGSFLDEAVKNILGPRRARIIFTDPPYNLAANQFTNKGEKRFEDFAMGGGEMNDQQFVDFLASIMRKNCDHSFPGSIHFICMDWRHIWHMSEAAKKIYGSVIPKQLIVWNKNIGANGSFYRAKHELVFIYKNGKEKHLSNIDLADRIRYNVWEYDSATSLSNPDRSELLNHPTPKPVQMVADAILDTTQPGDLVIDWFIGSGTTIIAADITNRIAFGTEIEPKYVQSDILRYIKHCEKTNKVPAIQHLNGPLTLQAFKLLLEEEVN